MKKHNILYTMAATCQLLLLACTEKGVENKLPRSGDIIPVKVSVPSTAFLSDSILTTGLLNTEEEARLSFKVTGVIDKVFVKEGDSFRKNQLLARLKADEINAQLEQARLILEKAKRDYVRMKNLYADSVATLEQLQNTQTALSIAQRTVDQIAFNRSHAFIYAPMDGFVARKMLNEGEIAKAGTPVLSVHGKRGLSSWVLKAGVTDEQWEAICPGQKASVTLDAFPAQQFAGTVLRKSQVADPASGSLQVEIAVHFGNEAPAVGMFGKANIHAGRQEKSLVIPYNALMEADGNKAFVFVPHGKQGVRKVPVLIRSFNGDHAVIQSGLEQTDRIIISNSAFLNEQSKILIVK